MPSQTSNGNSQPQITITLRPDGELAIVLPGAQAHERSPQIKAGMLEQIVRDILVAQLSAQERRIGGKAEPTQQALDHQNHSTFNSKCPFCQFNRIAETMEYPEDGISLSPSNVVRISSAKKQSKSIAKIGEVEVRTTETVYHCRCGFHGNHKEIAKHLSLLNPMFPRQPPQDFPHAELTRGEVQSRLYHQRKQDEKAKWAEAPVANTGTIKL